MIVDLDDEFWFIFVGFMCCSWFLFLSGFSEIVMTVCYVFYWPAHVQCRMPDSSIGCWDAVINGGGSSGGVICEIHRGCGKEGKRDCRWCSAVVL